MKTTLLIVGALLLAAVSTPIVADPTPVCDPTILLPPGPILAKTPDYSQWRILYSFASSGSDRSNPSSSSNTGAPPSAGDAHLPKTFTMTQTKPLWHAVLVDVSGVKTETWFDGLVRFEQAGDPARFVPIGNAPGEQLGNYYNGSQKDFPDVDWASRTNYLGAEKSTGYWVFQQSSDGATLWVDSTTHYPVRWRKDRETRVFQFLPAPADLLTLPPSIAKISQALRHLDELSRVAPPGL